MKFHALYYLLITCCFLYSCKKDKTDSAPNTISDLYIRGADISFYPDSKKYMNVKDSLGNTADMLDVFKSYGMNTARVRIWYAPGDSSSSLSEVRTLFATLKQKQIRTWLDFHYSDTWADPGSQQTPAAWKNLSYETLSDSVYHYTYRICSELQPDYVQVGNEINNGFLWPVGAHGNPEFFGLLKRGIQAVREAAPGALIMIHYAGLQGSPTFFNELANQKVEYDLAALSYYPWWHGKNIDSVGIALDYLYDHFGKKALIAETSYPFTLGWNDYTNNVIGDSSVLVKGYLPTPDGQFSYLSKLKELSSQSEKRAGFCYWGAEWIAYKGKTASNGSAWENLALFDFDAKPLPALRVFKKNN